MPCNMSQTCICMSTNTRDQTFSVLRHLPQLEACSWQVRPRNFANKGPVKTSKAGNKGDQLNIVFFSSENPETASTSHTHTAPHHIRTNQTVIGPAIYCFGGT